MAESFSVCLFVFFICLFVVAVVVVVVVVVVIIIIVLTQINRHGFLRLSQYGELNVQRHISGRNKKCC